MGCYHAFDLLSPKAKISKDAISFTLDSFAGFYDKYVALGPKGLSLKGVPI